MLRLLLDEHVSPAVATGIRRRNPRMTVYAMAQWHEGSYLGAEDAGCLEAAAVEKLTLVTYDRRTIPPLLKAWAEEDRHHGGVIFIDEKTISPADIGGQVIALLQLAELAAKWTWKNRVCFLRA
jgi:hypothetical protein